MNPPDLRQTSICNYAANPIIFPQRSYASERSYKVTTTQPQRNPQQILISFPTTAADRTPFPFARKTSREINSIASGVVHSSDAKAQRAGRTSMR